MELLGNTVSMKLILLAILLIAAALYAIDIKADYKLNLSLDEYVHSIEIRILFFKKKFDIANLPKPKQKKSKIKISVKGYGILLKEFLRRAKVPYFFARLEIGLGDAFATAMSCGGAQTAVYTALSFILPSNKKHLLSKFKISPNFERECLDIAVSCIVSIKLANIIPVLIRAIKLLKRSD